MLKDIGNFGAGAKMFAELVRFFAETGEIDDSFDLGPGRRCDEILGGGTVDGRKILDSCGHGMDEIEGGVTVAERRL